MVDIPGVAKGDVNIEITENDVIVIRAKNSHVEPDNPLLQQYGVGNYYRVFQISNELDKDRVNVVLDNEQREIRVQKREKLKPRKIAITAYFYFYSNKAIIMKFILSVILFIVAFAVWRSSIKMQCKKK